ncbi:DnaJ-class molecular chaperone with C-terminal Zn finger domain [Desulfosporosinus orientis DSM 765]|uniref:DnaJ-class molecular chaperone with C-terminal Zn finger domain n=1 Tax=Desulfosporosinus orientis (strain ATCC 19365 / DSM 765 / NCIMB 8382 / VKM B-1628 / Singapore I) TaxID=768706 RepID=G7W695_DESOD|nr:molecular chaperone DnaJ [Desulfosporosinus orientis]AET68102.1 DnaJ-class molecular chaperone with C-terminal Zn finger domain [Desulfosporosinus orientis DSM 765]
MVNINNPNEVLAAVKCGDLYSNDPVKAKEEYRLLVQKYHPDRSKEARAEDVFRKIRDLYAQAESLFVSGQWEESNVREFKTKEGKYKRLKFIKEFPFELGVQYVASSVVVYVLEAEHKKYFDNALQRVSSLRYENKAMEDEFKRYFPEFMDKFETAAGEWVLVIKKTKDFVRLQDLLNYYQGKIEPRHAAWMLSRLGSICCFLDYNGLAHNGISLENCFVSPENHSIALLGGWWYCVGQGEKMLGTQKQIYDVMGPLIKTNKAGCITTDLESIKLMGRELLNKAQVPDSYQAWLEKGSADSARKEFVGWNTALRNSYGPRKFISMEVGEKEVYSL